MCVHPDTHSTKELKTKDRDEFMTEMMPHIAATSKKYFVLSSQYFDTKDKGALELLKPVTHFAVPRLLNGVQVREGTHTHTHTHSLTHSLTHLHKNIYNISPRRVGHRHTARSVTEHRTQRSSNVEHL